MSIKVELMEVNVVRGTDGTFIIRTVGENGVSDITTSPDFNGLIGRLNELLVVTTAIASQQAAPALQQ